MYLPASVTGAGFEFSTVLDDASHVLGASATGVAAAKGNPNAGAITKVEVETTVVYVATVADDRIQLSTAQDFFALIRSRYGHGDSPCLPRGGSELFR